MKDKALDGPAPADNPSDGGAARSLGSDGAAPAAATSGGDGWSAALDEDNRRLVEHKGWQSANDALTSYRELDEYRGRSVALPGDQASEADWRAFRRKTGMPDEAEGYRFADDGDTGETPTGALKQLFHDAGLDQHQARSLHDGLQQAFRACQDQVASDDRQRREQVLADARSALTEAWGAEQGDSYRRNLEMARRAVEALGGEPLFDELRQLGALSPDNEILSPLLAEVFAEVGGQLFAEDSLIEGAEPLTVNPFAGDSLNLARQGDLVTRDPARARRLIEAAGKRPEDYGLSSHPT